MPTDPLPQSEPWIERPLSTEDLEALRVRLSKMTHADLVKFYDAGLHMCRMNHGVPPSAGFIQQLVQAWKELQWRQKAKT
jgi:hypothetical protein